MKYGLSVIICSMLLALMNGCTSKSQTIRSPDGSMVIVTSVEKSKADPKTYHCVVFEVRNIAGQVLVRQNTHASDAMKWSMNWVSTNEIQLDSSDIGTYFWERQADGTWKMK